MNVRVIHHHVRFGLESIACSLHSRHRTLVSVTRHHNMACHQSVWNQMFACHFVLARPCTVMPAGALLLILCLRGVLGGWPGGERARPPERRRAAEADRERYIVTLCPDATSHEAHEQLAAIGLLASRNFSRVLHGFALEGVNDELHEKVRVSRIGDSTCAATALLTAVWRTSPLVPRGVPSLSRHQRPPSLTLCPPPPLVPRPRHGERFVCGVRRRSSP